MSGILSFLAAGFAAFCVVLLFAVLGVIWFIAWLWRRARLGEFDKAMRALRRDDYQDAARLFGRYAARWDQDRQRARLFQSVALIKSGDTVKALEVYKTIDLVDCLNEEIYELATQAEGRKLDEQALRLYRHLSVTSPGFADVERRIGTLTGQLPSSTGTIVDLEGTIKSAVGDKYEDLRELGWGGMGAVFTAVDSGTREKVAIKVLDPRYARDDQVVRRFYREIVAVSNLSHPSIPRILDIKKAALPFYVMEFVEGEALDKLLARQPRLPMDKALHIAVKVARILEYAHGMHVIHRDVKPANIIICPDENVKLLDFGIAKIEENTTITGTGQILGTPQYMAPEQFKGQTVTASVDVYAVGILLFELLTGEMPFMRNAPQERVFKEAPLVSEYYSGCPDEIVNIVSRCLKKEPGARYLNGAALARSLESALTGV